MSPSVHYVDVTNDSMTDGLTPHTLHLTNLWLFHIELLILVHNVN